MLTEEIERHWWTQELLARARSKSWAWGLACGIVVGVVLMAMVSA